MRLSAIGKAARELMSQAEMRRDDLVTQPWITRARELAEPVQVLVAGRR
jgi:hypothetical protein